MDLGALILRNETVKAVGNMGVNARGDRVDGTNQIIDQKNRQAQRRYQQQTAPLNENVQKVTSTAEAKRMKAAAQQSSPADPVLDMDVTANETPVPQVSTDPTDTTPRGGLAAAIARNREIKQELDKTPRQLAQEKGLRKI